MPPTTHRIAQTTTEAKRQYKKNGPGIPERQQRQLQRAHELDERASRLREAEKRRVAAKKKREEKEEQQQLLRQQQGISVASQAVGYNHTQARAKNWMESFLGVDKKKQEARRQREIALTKKMDEISQALEKEPWDDDEGDGLDALDLPVMDSASGEKWADDDLDDDSLLEAHDQIMSDPAVEPPAGLPATPTSDQVVSVSITPEGLNDAAFAREHGFINRLVENTLHKLPGSLVELLSQDVSLRLPEWEPPSSLLHKLNPMGVPPHRLRLKTGCVVTVLRDLNTSSQLSKSQHLQILRIESERIECLVLDGQLEGTKTFLTRIPFLAKYKNLDQHPFQRMQFPIRVAAEYTLPTAPRQTSQSGFKLPAIPGRLSSKSSDRTSAVPNSKGTLVSNQNPSFKLPGIPASKARPTISPHLEQVEAVPQTLITPLDGWDDFLESGTQIARELSLEVVNTAAKSSSAPAIPSLTAYDPLPPLSTQDLDFSLEDLEDDSPIIPAKTGAVLESGIQATSRFIDPHLKDGNVSAPLSEATVNAIATDTKEPKPAMTANRGPDAARKVLSRAQVPVARARPIDLSALRASQKPCSVSDRPGLKRKAHTTPFMTDQSSSKRQCSSATELLVPATTTTHNAACMYDSLNDFFPSTQDACSFFDDDDYLFDLFGTPPLSV